MLSVHRCLQHGWRDAARRASSSATCDTFFSGGALPPSQVPPGPDQAYWIHLCVPQNSSRIYAYRGEVCGRNRLQKEDRVFGRPFVKRFALWYRTAVLSVCDVGVLWPNSSMDQDETCMEVALVRPRPHCVRWRPSSELPLPKRGTHPIFGPCLLWSNGWVD